MALTVLSVAFPFAPVGPAAAGGAEQVLSVLDEALVRAGHRSIVVAMAGSQVHGELEATPKVDGLIDDVARRRAWAAHRAAIEAVLASERVDVVHLHGLDFIEYVPREALGRVPMVATLHLPPAWYPPRALAPDSGVALVCVSATQQKACPPEAPVVATVGNGVRLDRLRPGPQVRRRELFAALGRICPEKGFHLALEAAHASGAALLLAGQVFDYVEHRAYVEEEIRPRLDARRRFLGPAGPRMKRRLLRMVRALLVPSLVEETSSLVSMEAAACGTPVIALRRGALPEIVEHGRTGFIVDDADGLREAMAHVREIDPDLCRRTAEARFSADDMVARYLELYRERAVGFFRAPASRARVRVDLVRTRAGLERIGPEWASLWARCPGAPPFAHPAWLLPWCARFGREEVFSFAVWDGQRLVALAPMEVWPEGGTRVLKLLGSGVSDALDVLVDPDARARWLAHLTRAIAETAREWDLLELAPLREGAAALSLGVAPVRREACDVSPVLSLEGAGSLRDVLPRRSFDNLAYARRRLERTLGAHIVRCDTQDGAEGLLDELVRLHSARWQGMKAQPGVFGDPRMVAFLRDATPRLLEAGLLGLYALTSKDATLGVLYGLSAHGRSHYYLSGFDPAHARHSPGSVVIAAAIEDAIARGDGAFDFLRGAEPYKYTWGAVDAALWRLIAVSRRARSSQEATACSALQDPR